jgi:hypothetical protein
MSVEESKKEFCGLTAKILIHESAVDHGGWISSFIRDTLCLLGFIVEAELLVEALGLEVRLGLMISA